MKNLDWGLLEDKKIINTELLNKTNIKNFISQNEIDLISRAIFLYKKEHPSKRFPTEFDNFYLKTGKSENNIIYIEIDIPIEYKFWDQTYTDYNKITLNYKEDEPFKSSVHIQRIDDIKIVSTQNTIKINSGKPSLFIRKNDDETLDYIKYGGFSTIKINKKDKANMKKIKNIKDKYVEILQNK